MSDRKLILAAGESETADAFEVELGIAAYFVGSDEVQEQRGIGAAVVLREMAAEMRSEATMIRRDTPCAAPIDDAFALERWAERIEARAAELEADNGE